MSSLRSGIVVAFLTLVSRITGLLRELVIANMFGSSAIGDAVQIAIKLPNLLRRILGEGALATTFVPIYTRTLQEKALAQSDESVKFITQIFVLLSGILLIISCTMYYFLPQIVVALAPGFQNIDNKFDFTVLICEYTLPYTMLICLSALIGSVCNSHRHFAIFAGVPVVLNFAIVFALLRVEYATNEEAAINVAKSVTIAGIIQLAAMLIYTKIFKIKLFNSNFVKISQQEVAGSNIGTFFKNIVPAVISSSIGQINLFISQAIASFIPGAISILSYAERIYQFPLSIIGVCFGTILLPSLSRAYGSKKAEEALDIQTKSVLLGLFLAIASTCGIVALSHPIIHIIYFRGAFTAADTNMTADAMSGFVLGLPAFILTKIIAPIFYANLNVKTPTQVSVITIILNIIFNIVFMKLWGHVGIALGTTLAAWCNVAILITMLQRHKIKFINDSIYGGIMHLMVIGMGMGGVVYGLSLYLSEYIYNFGLMTSIFVLLFIIAIGFIVYVAGCLLYKPFLVMGKEFMQKRKGR